MEVGVGRLSRMPRWEAWVIGVGVVLPLHCLVQLLAYGYWQRGDLLTLGVPAAGAWVAYAWLISRVRGERVTQNLVVALAPAFFSTWLSMVAPLNLYGE